MGLAQALAVLCPDGPTAAAHQQAVRQALAEGRAFRDLQVPVLRLARQGQPAGLRWWSIMAKPWADRDGQQLGWIGVIADVTEARQAEQLLLRKADFDGLTGLANRGQLMQRLGSILRSDESATPRRCALLLLDLDHFKTVNDRWGHASSDAVLIAAAQRMTSCLRAGDLAARLAAAQRRRRQLEESLGLALANRQLGLLWQARFGASDWSVTGAKATLHWQHPDLGLVPTADIL